MRTIDILHSQWKEAYHLMHCQTGFQRLLGAELSPDAYRSLLKEIYYQVSYSSRLPAFAAAHFRGRQCQALRGFLEHVQEAAGQEEWVLQDLEELGASRQQVFFRKPLAATESLLAYPYFKIQFESPLHYLGYLFPFEIMMVEWGSVYLEKLRKAGISEGALTYFKSQIKVDNYEHSWMARYISNLVETEEELWWVIHSTKVTAELYGRMVSSAVEKAEKGEVRKSS